MLQKIYKLDINYLISMRDAEFKDKIYQFLVRNDKGATASEIAKDIISNRMTVTKYLEMMKIQDLVAYRGVGMAKLWSINPSPILTSFDNGENMLLKDVMNVMGEGVSVINKKMEIVWYNEKMAEWCGKLESNKGKHCYEVYQKRGSVCANCPTIQTFNSGSAKKAVQPGIDTKGKKRFFDLITTPIKDKKGNIIGVMEIVTSLDDYKRKMAELKDLLGK